MLLYLSELNSERALLNKQRNVLYIQRSIGDLLNQRKEIITVIITYRESPVTDCYTGKTVQYSGEGINATNSNNKDLWIKGITLAVKINKFWASSIGFRQFINVNYTFSGSKSILGNNENYSAVYEDDGGLNDYYWTNAFSVGKHFLVGIKSSVIAGNINQAETIINDAANAIETKQQDYFGSPGFEFGAIYSGSINKKWDFSVGDKFINKTRLGSERFGKNKKR